MPTAVVTGANSGIGHAFAQLLIEEGYEVHAADVQVGEKLQALQCRLHRLDVRAPESIHGLAAQLAGKPVDLLLNVAGVMDPPAQDALGTVTQEALARVFETNTFGPLLLSQALLDNVLAAAAGNGGAEGAGDAGAGAGTSPPSTPPRIGIVSSRVGSIGDNASGGSYGYRASKAAVNAIGRSMAVDLKARGIVVALLHPGIVNTGLTAGSESHPESVEPVEAAAKLYAVLMSKGLEDTGRFWHREGQELPW